MVTGRTMSERSTPRLSARCKTQISRRDFLKVGVAAGGGLFVEFAIPSARGAKMGLSGDPAFSPNAFIRIDRAGAVTLIMPQVEMGQGVYTSLSMILAEELDVRLESVTLEAAPPNDALYTNPALGFQVTGGSTSIRGFWMPLRRAGASARAMLIGAAATTWNVDPPACSTAAGEVIHAASGRRLPYGSLVDRAAQLKPPANPMLKTLEEFRLIGTAARRLDTPDKVTGKALFGIDALPPGVKFATLMASPVLGGKVIRIDDAAARAIPGVRQIVVLDDLVAVVADHTWAAKQGLDVLNIAWDDGPNAHVTTEEIFDQLKAASERTGIVAKSAGDVTKELGAAGRVEATYHVPFLAHAPMEPMNCTVHVRADGCEIWVGNQVLTRAQAIAAKITGFPKDKVIVHNHLIGGGFGRRLEVDGIAKSVRIAQKVDGPVKVIWTREEDIQKALYRPFYFDRFEASLSGAKITAWKHRVVGSSILARWAPPAFVNGLDSDAVEGAVKLPYDVPNFHVEYVRQEPPGIQTCFWRGVGPTHNIFVTESFVDELAHNAGKDPVRFRRDQLGKAPRLLACLDLVASKAGWGQALPRRVGQGIAIQNVFGTNLATVAVAEVDDHGEVSVRRIVCAVDCGIVVNPDTVVAQIEGGLIFGLTAALHGEITLAKGRVQQSNFNNYRMMRINEAPKIEVHLIQSVEAPGGIGEPGTAAAAPALANALFAATGVRLRKLPIDRQALAAGKSA
jgi:isoquinoline 1-oxidoreductase subunit beta